MLILPIFGIQRFLKVYFLCFFFFFFFYVFTITIPIFWVGGLLSIIFLFVFSLGKFKKEEKEKKDGLNPQWRGGGALGPSPLFTFFILLLMKKLCLKI